MGRWCRSMHVPSVIMEVVPNDNMLMTKCICSNKGCKKHMHKTYTHKHMHIKHMHINICI